MVTPRGAAATPLDHPSLEPGLKTLSFQTLFLGEDKTKQKKSLCAPGSVPCCPGSCFFSGRVNLTLLEARAWELLRHPRALRPGRQSPREMSWLLCLNIPGLGLWDLTPNFGKGPGELGHFQPHMVHFLYKKLHGLGFAQRSDKGE